MCHYEQTRCVVPRTEAIYKQMLQTSQNIYYDFTGLCNILLVKRLCVRFSLSVLLIDGSKKKFVSGSPNLWTGPSCTTQTNKWQECYFLKNNNQECHLFLIIFFFFFYKLQTLGFIIMMKYNPHGGIVQQKMEHKRKMKKKYYLGMESSPNNQLLYYTFQAPM